MKEPASPAIRVATKPAGVECLLEHGDFLQRMVSGLLGDSHDSEDVVQQTWLSVLTTSSEPVRQPRTWLAKIAKNRSIDMLRRRRGRLALEEPADVPARRPGPDELLELESVRSSVSAAVDRLAEPYRTSIELRFFEGLPPREVARRMGVPVETARTRIKRALASLRSRLDADFPGGRRAWVVALLRLRQSDALRRVPPARWRPLTIGALCAGLLTLLLVGGGRTARDARLGAGAADEEAGERTALNTLEDGGANAEDGEDALGRHAWDTWPPVPAVEVERSTRRRRGLEQPGGGGAWAALRAETVAASPAAPAPAGRSGGAEAASGPAPGAASGHSSAWVAASVDQSTPLDVSLEERVAPGRVWSVDPSGAGDFETLAAAAAAAGPGDALLLAAGEAAGYDALSLSRKGISLLGLGEEPVLVRGLSLSELAANQTVVLRNLRLAPLPGRSALAVEDVRGSVWIEDSILTATDADTIRVESSAALAILRCAVDCAGARADGQPPAALSVFASDVSVFDSELRGGPASRRPAAVPSDGGHGAVVSYGRLFAMGSRFEGGAGTDQLLAGTLSARRGGDGGMGLWVEGEARTLGCSFAGGTPGSGLLGRGAPGQERVGPIEEITGALRRYALRQAGDGATALVAEGEPGDVVLSVVGGAPSRGYLPLHLGTRLVAPPYEIAIEGIVPASGRLERAVEVPAGLLLAGGFERYYAQGFFFDAHGEAYLAGASTVYVLP